MQARGPLMIEHRLIEEMLNAVERRLGAVDQARSIDPSFVDAVVDFVRVYADRTHHGKEEDILFRELRKKELSPEHRQVMDELVAEHAFGRQTTRALAEANARHRGGDGSALADVTAHLKTLGEFYPRHIDKEDSVFFPATVAYLSEEEDEAVLAEFRAFDRQMIHEKYRAVVKGLAGA